MKSWHEIRIHLKKKHPYLTCKHAHLYCQASSTLTRVNWKKSYMWKQQFDTFVNINSTKPVQDDFDPISDRQWGSCISKQPLQVQSFLLCSLQHGQIVWQTQTLHSVEERSLSVLLSLRVYFPFNSACITKLGGGLLPLAIQFSGLDCSWASDSQWWIA